jgi:pimeloyl-ACP methyl ester carboxylesterase
VTAGSRTRLVLAIAAVTATVAAAPASAEDPPPGSNDFNCKPTAQHPRPVILVHGLAANMSLNWSYDSPQLAAAGYCVFALTYGLDERTAGWPYRPGGLVPMQQSSKELKVFVKRVLKATGARKVDLIGHSEGTVMPRWYLERRNGARNVKRFIALTPLWDGTQLGGLPTLRDTLATAGLSQAAIDAVSGFCASCPQFLKGSTYLNELNADGIAVPGIVHTNIVTRYDELVTPYTSGLMPDGGTNIVVQDVCPADVSEHGAVAFDPVVTQMLLNALDPRDAQPVKC